MQISNFDIVGGKSTIGYEFNLTWENPTLAFEKIRIVWNTTATPTAIDDGTIQEITDGTAYWTHLGLASNTTYYYAIYVYDGSTWGTPTTASLLSQDAFAFGEPLAFYIQDANGDPLVGHKVSVARTRDSGNFVVAEVTTMVITGGATVATWTLPAQATTTLWVGDEVTVTVNDALDALVYTRTLPIDGSMLSTQGVIATVAPAAVTAQYPATPTIPAGVNLSTTNDTTPEFIWNHTPDPDNSPGTGEVHYAIELDTDNSFTNTDSDYHLYKSVTDATPFEYSLEASSYETWLPFPANGLIETGNARIRFTAPAALSETTWYWRVYSTDLTLA